MDVVRGILLPILKACAAAVAWMLGISLAHWVASSDPDLMGQEAAIVVFAVVITIQWLNGLRLWDDPV